MTLVELRDPVRARITVAFRPASCAVRESYETRLALVAGLCSQVWPGGEGMEAALIESKNACQLLSRPWARFPD